MLHICLMLLICLLADSAYSNLPSKTSTKTDQQKESKSTKTADKTNQDLRGTPENPLVINVLPSQNAEERAKRKPETEEEKSTLDRWMTGASVSLVIITAILAFYTALLWRATNKLVMGSEKTAKQQLRAYINVEDVTFVNESAHPTTNWTETHIEVRLKNFGQVPATQVEYWVSVGIHEFPLRTSVSEEKGIRRIGVISPSGSFTIKTHPGIDAPHHNQSAMYVFGEVSYFDGLEPNRRTHLCYMRRGGDGWSWHGELETCQEGNAAT